MASGPPSQFADFATRSVVLSLLFAVTLVCTPPSGAAALADNPARAAPRDAPTLLVFAAGRLVAAENVRAAQRRHRLS